MGFNRSKLLDYLIEREGWDMTFIKNKGYAISDGSRIGPLIANDKETAFSLINQYLSSGPKTITVPEYLESELKQYSPEKRHTCIKMIYGINLTRNHSLVWSYCRFATS